MRSIFIASLLFVSALAPAAAQTPGASELAAPAQAGAPQGDQSQSATAVRDIFSALLFDTGMFDAIVANQLPAMRQSFVTSPLYRQTTQRRRDALNSFIDALPGIMREEFEAELTVMAQNAAPRVSSLMQPDELSAIAAFFRDPELRPLIDRMVSAGIADGFSGSSPQPEPNAAEMARLDEIERSPAGRALQVHGEEVLTILGAEMDAATPRITPRLQDRVLRGMCEALETDCPREVRQALRGA